MNQNLENYEIEFYLMFANERGETLEEFLEGDF